MDHLNIREKLLPVLSVPKKEEVKKEQKIEFKDSISVNKLLSKTVKDPFDIRLEELTPKKAPKIPKKFNNLKEEHHYRLNRTNKLKVNEKLTNYISNTKDSTNKTTKTIKNENDQIEDASKQIKEINRILETKEANTKKPKSKTNSFETDHKKKQPKRSISSDSGITHMCTKGLRSRINNYNMIIEKFERQLKMREDNKFNSSNSEIMKHIFEKKGGDCTAKTETNMLKKFGRNIRNYVPPKRPQFKYKSLKDLKIDEEKLRKFEEEVRLRCKLAEDPTETTVLYENQVFKKQCEFYSEDRLLNQGKETSVDNFNDFLKKHQKDVRIKKDEVTLGINNQLSIQEGTGANTMTIKFDQTFPTSSVQKPVLPEKIQESLRKIKPRLSTAMNSSKKSIGLETNAEENVASELHKSILKSDYLMKEFHLNTRPDVYPLPNLITKDIPAEILNWADKYKPPKKWPKELEYLIS